MDLPVLTPPSAERAAEAVVCPVPPDAIGNAFVRVTTWAVLIDKAVVPLVCKPSTPLLSAVDFRPADPLDTPLSALIVDGIYAAPCLCQLPGNDNDRKCLCASGLVFQGTNMTGCIFVHSKIRTCVCGVSVTREFYGRCRVIEVKQTTIATTRNVNADNCTAAQTGRQVN